MSKLPIELPDKASDLLELILDYYPEEDALTLRKVMSVGKVVYSEAPGMTAAVMNTRPYTLIFGKPFIEENIQTMEDLVYLLSHELTHLVLDHFAPDIIKEFEDKKLAKKAAHIIVDCQVNATVSNSLDPKYSEFVKRYYSQDMPYCFFRPDGEPPTDELKALHQKLHSTHGITNRELIEGLMEWFKDQQDQLDQIIENLLGNHDDLFKDRAGNASSGELEDLVDVVADNFLNRGEQSEGSGKPKESEGDPKKANGSKEAERGNKAGDGGPLVESKFKEIKEVLSQSRLVRKAFSKAGVVSPAARIYRAIDSFSPKYSRRSVVPNFRDRRTVALNSIGKLPVFHQNIEVGSKVMVPCYLDVSGSQEHVLHEMRKVVLKLKDLLGNKIYCFSTVISETPLKKIKDGSYYTTGGTDFSPVLRHILKNNFRQAVIFTDGEASAAPQLVDQIRRRGVNITVGWTTPRPNLHPLDQLAKKTLFVFD